MGLPARILSPIGSTILQGAPMPHAIRPSPEERKQTAVTDEDAFFWMTPSFWCGVSVGLAQEMWVGGERARVGDGQGMGYR